MKIRMWAFIAIGIFSVGGYCGVTRLQARRAMERARLAIKMHDWRTARNELQAYLGVFPADESARLSLAEAYFKDATLGLERAVSLASQQLEQIRPESRHFPAACIQKGRMCLFARSQPHRAESLFRKVLATDWENSEAHYLLWKLLDLTGRSHLAEPHFRKVLEATPDEQRPDRLREWYMSQFYPAMANPEIDQMMGFLEPGAVHHPVIELKRLEAFRDREPRSALNHAAVARWFSLEGDPKQALQLLQTALDVADAPLQEPFYVATLVQVLFDLGEFDNALKYFRAWPARRSGYEYSRLEAMLADEVEKDYPRAIASYRQVISVWPGQADWRIQFRLARCLAKAGDESAAEEMRQRAKKIELLMEEEVHAPLRQMLKNPAELEICERMTQFYEQLGLAFETGQWRDQFLRRRRQHDRHERIGEEPSDRQRPE